MKSQTSLVAKQVRLQQWADQIRSCQSRAKNMTVETWCEMHGISKANYYYRLRCVREACLEQVQNEAPEFVEIPSSRSNIQEHHNSCNGSASAILHGPNNISVELLPSASQEFLTALIGAFGHVK